MKIGWKTKNSNLKPEEILKKIERIKKISNDGRVSFEAFEYHNAFASLFSMIELPSKLDGLNLDSILSRSISITATAGVLTKDALMENIQKICRAELATREEKYCFLTSISINPAHLTLKSIHIEDTHINFFSGEYPKKYSSRSQEIKASHRVLVDEHEEYCKVKIQLKAKSDQGATKKALRSLDILRAIMALFGNSGMELMGNKHAPINKVRLGQTHTLHYFSGKPAKSSVWYEPYFEAGKVYSPSKPEIFRNNVKWALSKLNKSNYGRTIKDSLLRYVRALDEREHNSALIRLWGALECIASPSDSNKDGIPRRCAFLFEESEFHQQILEHLREHRNQSVHAGEESERAKTYCYQIQFYFRELILFHLRRSDDFQTLAEANQFLDLPAKPSDLQKKIDLYKKALEFHGGSTDTQ